MSANHKSHVFKTEVQIAKKLCRSFDTPRALTITMLIENEEWDQLLKLECKPEHYLTLHEFRDDYQLTSLLTKSASLPTGIDKQKVAFDKWVSAETQCRASNERLRLFQEGLVNPTSSHILSILDRTRAIIAEILGPLTRRTLTEVANSCNFGPGATTGVSGIVTAGRKYSYRSITTTKRLLDFGLFCLPDLWRQNVEGFDLRETSKLTFVPKNSKTDRAIAIENDLNIYVQKGIGAILRRKLKNEGIDLTTQADHNKRLASKCWETNGCTIDLSSASDTISSQAVMLLLPYDWVDLLYFARSDFTSYKGEIFELEKWSSMGNGYTFELETLIFYAILKATKEIFKSSHQIATFGDDLICGLDIMNRVIDTLNFLGFSVNSEKSFGKGVFHESCGGDFYLGVNVRPIFLRFDEYDAPIETHRYLYANLLRRWAYARNGHNSCDVRCLSAWLYCFTAVPKKLRYFVPNWDYSDQGFVGGFDEARPTIRRQQKDGWAGYKFRIRTRRAIERVICMTGSYISSLRNGSDFSFGSEALRGRKGPARTRLGYVLTWPCYGSWV